MAQQTAVDWLVEMITDMIHEVHHSELADLYESAKQIEREQMEKAYKQPLFSDCQTFDQYYNETYGNNQNK